MDNLARENAKYCLPKIENIFLFPYNLALFSQVRLTLVPRKSILDHAKLQSRFAKKVPENSIISGLKYV